MIIPDEEWTLAVQRETVVRPLVQKGTLTSDDVRNACAELGIKKAMLYRLLKRYREDRRASSLVPRKRGRPQGHSAISADLAKIIEDAISNYYLTSQKPRLSKLRHMIAIEARKRGLPCPSLNAITRRVHNIDLKVLIAKREGTKAANDKTRPVPGSLEVKRPLEIVQVDHTKIDVFVVDETHRLPIQRPWLTLLIDIASRMVTGYYLSLEAPSSTSVALALQHSVLKKDKWLDARGITAPWPVAGLPEALHMDNGKEFHAKALIRGAQEYGITLLHRPVRQPHFGGHIERLIGTMMGEIHLLPGTTFSDIESRGNYDPERHAAMTLKELDQWLAIQIVGKYHCRSASNPDPPEARAGAKPSGATLRCAPPALAPRRHNLSGGQLFEADPGQRFAAV